MNDVRDAVKKGKSAKQVKQEADQALDIYEVRSLPASESQSNIHALFYGDDHDA